MARVERDATRRALVHGDAGGARRRDEVANAFAIAAGRECRAPDDHRRVVGQRRALIGQLAMLRAIRLNECSAGIRRYSLGLEECREANAGELIGLHLKRGDRVAAKHRCTDPGCPKRTDGKLGVLCLAPEEGLGISDPEFRAKVGEDKITLARRYA